MQEVSVKPDIGALVTAIAEKVVNFANAPSKHGKCRFCGTYVYCNPQLHKAGQI